MATYFPSLQDSQRQRTTSVIKFPLFIYFQDGLAIYFGRFSVQVEMQKFRKNDAMSWSIKSAVTTVNNQFSLRFCAI